MLDINAFLTSLPIMLKGMVGIFVVIILIILVVMFLNKVTEGKQNEEVKWLLLDMGTPN